MKLKEAVVSEYNAINQKRVDVEIEMKRLKRELKIKVTEAWELQDLRSNSREVRKVQNRKVYDELRRGLQISED